MGGAAVFDHADAARRHLIDYPVIERDHAVGNVLLQSESRQSPVAPLPGHDDRDAFSLQPAKEPAQLAAHDGLIRQAGKKSFDGIQDHTFGLDGIDGIAQSDEEPFQVVLARLLDLAPIDVHVIDQHLSAGDEPGHIEAQRRRVLGQFLARFFKGDEDARLPVLGNAANEKLHRQQSLAAAGAAAHQRGSPGGQTASGNFVQAPDARGRFGQTLCWGIDLFFHSEPGGQGQLDVTALGRPQPERKSRTPCSSRENSDRSKKFVPPRECGR